MGLLTWRAIDGEQGLVGNLPRSAEVTRGGGDEDLGRVHENEIGTSAGSYIALASFGHILSFDGPCGLWRGCVSPHVTPEFSGVGGR